jgi:hypothetical protein
LESDCDEAFSSHNEIELAQDNLAADDTSNAKIKLGQDRRPFEILVVFILSLDVSVD